MALQFQPRPGTIVMCDFRGYEVPEMVKVRPVVVLARNRRAHGLVTVVPLSTTRPEPLDLQHHELAQSLLPGKTGPCWAKCDMVATVGLGRLDRIKFGKRDFRAPALAAADILAIRHATAHALGLGGL